MEQHVLQRTCQKAMLNGDHMPLTEVLQRFLLAGLMMCVNVRSDFKLHWSSDSLLANQELKSLVSRNTFQSTLNLIHPDPQILVDTANLNLRAHWHPFDHTRRTPCGSRMLQKNC
jgi:hypothetical protein